MHICSCVTGMELVPNAIASLLTAVLLARRQKRQPGLRHTRLGCPASKRGKATPEDIRRVEARRAASAAREESLRRADEVRGAMRRGEEAQVGGNVSDRQNGWMPTRARPVLPVAGNPWLENERGEWRRLVSAESQEALQASKKSGVSDRSRPQVARGSTAPPWSQRQGSRLGEAQDRRGSQERRGGDRNSTTLRRSDRSRSTSEAATFPSGRDSGRVDVYKPAVAPQDKRAGDGAGGFIGTEAGPKEYARPSRPGRREQAERRQPLGASWVPQVSLAGRATKREPLAPAELQARRQAASQAREAALREAEQLRQRRSHQDADP